MASSIAADSEKVLTPLLGSVSAEQKSEVLPRRLLYVYLYVNIKLKPLENEVLLLLMVELNFFG